ncbi:hypothetical protein Agub_g15265 [Astrephomene gubernaculifera]|uniref:Sulfotransferase family protein n=1 Tax=Astrephomene gubernaculifera TaxID=47775 RepID=A0AAD3HTT6_9CHLO|nr:hypothetical protein Agub_g15265 [Astrephomene gubernaculifera]
MSDVEVIGAGFGRTGTLSLYTALNRLGYKTHHMKEVIMTGTASGWLQAARDRAAGRPINWDSILGGYTATVDWPAAAFYSELLAANPNAKVILTLRDFDSWYESALATVYTMGECGSSIRPPAYLAPLFRPLTNLFSMNDLMFKDGIFEGRFLDKEFVRKVYESHHAEVRRVVPPGQLLEFHVKEGWGPLCAFLGKPVPEGEPFPRVNDTAEFLGNIAKVRKLARVLSVFFAASNAALVAAAAASVVAAVQAIRNRL